MLRHTFVSLSAVRAALVLCTAGGFAADATAARAQAAPAKDASVAQIHPSSWPAVKRVLRRDPAIASCIHALLQKMSVEDKVGRLIQADIASIKPADLRTYRLGLVLVGGNSEPNGNEFDSPASGALWSSISTGPISSRRRATPRFR